MCSAYCAGAYCQTTPEEPLYPASMASGTIPLMHIHTANRDSILDKVTKIQAELYVEVPENSDLEPLGNKENPVTLTIRGRGNASWKLPKKPYKIKFTEKTKILGLPSNRDFALIAWDYGSGGLGWLASICGMELCRIIGMPWAPHIQPVELVLNDNYEGLYFLTETVKISKKRLNIFEQPENNEDEDTIPYGWLVEFDNYADDPQIIIPETDRLRLRVTSHSPDALSDAQTQWLTEEFTSLNEAVYSNGAIDWTERIDLTSLSQYYIIREIMYDTDGFSGSVYLYRDLGENAKWHFGPMWDIGLGAGVKDDYTMNLLPPYAVAHWIKEMVKYADFRDEFLRVWNDFYPEKFNRMQQMASEVAAYCAEADRINAGRWDLSYYTGKDASFWRRVSGYAQWLDENKYWPMATLTGVREVTVDSGSATGRLYDMTGREVRSTSRPGLYISEDGRKRLVR